MSQQEPEAGPSTIPPPPPLEETIDSLVLDFNDSTESNSKVKSKNRKSKSKEPKPTPAPQVKLPKAPKPVPTPIEAFENPAEGEEETVHGVYESIAPHFSQTRHKVSEVSGSPGGYSLSQHWTLHLSASQTMRMCEKEKV